MAFPFKILRRWRLGCLKPASRSFGFNRGEPIDRYYIAQFLEEHRPDIQGRVLEIGDRGYTTRFGSDKVTCSDVLHADPGNTEATLVGDLATGDGIPDGSFECMILTQTLPFIYDAKAAILHSYNKLADGGVLLATFPGISQISRYDMDRWGDFWRFTDASAHRLFGEVFGPDNIKIETHGNVLVASAFLYGLASRELSAKELKYKDRDYQVLITVRAVKRTDR